MKHSHTPGPNRSHRNSGIVQWYTDNNNNTLANLKRIKGAVCMDSFPWVCYGHFYDTIKIAIFKTLRRLDTT